MRENGEREIGDTDECMHCGKPIKLERIYIEIDYVPGRFGQPICLEDVRGEWVHMMDNEHLCCNGGCGAFPKHGGAYNKNDADGYA